MNWTKEHIEARMLDAIEGRLSEDQLIQLHEILREHPELGDLDPSLIYINHVDAIEFDHASLLKKESFNPEAYQSEDGLEKEKMSIANMEGLLSIQEEMDFKQIIKVDPELKDHWQLVQQTKLIPNPKIVFPSIETLMKDQGKVLPFRLYFSYVAAASIMLLLFLNWPSPEVPVKSASKTAQKSMKVAQKDTKPQVETTIKTIERLPIKHQNIGVEQIDLGQNQVRDCIVQEDFPSVEQMPNETTHYLTPPIVDPIELASATPTLGTMRTLNSTKKSEPIGLREFVIQKGNERLFGTPNPSVSERYSTIANYMAKSTSIPINYEQRSTQNEEITYVRLGFISIERKRTKK